MQYATKFIKPTFTFLSSEQIPSWIRDIPQLKKDDMFVCEVFQEQPLLRILRDLDKKTSTRKWEVSAYLRVPSGRFCKLSSECHAEEGDSNECVMADYAEALSIFIACTFAEFAEEESYE